MKKYKIVLLLILIFGLPLLGAAMGEASFDYSRVYDPSAILIYSRDALPKQPFSWTVTVIMVIIGLAPLVFAAIMMMKSARSSSLTKPVKPYPFWGWAGAASLILFWGLSWGAVARPEILKQLNFTLLWLSYIVVINGLSCRRKGECLLIDHAGYTLRLFVASIPFWWTFEYLNRFVLNWYYLGDEAYSAYEYLFFGTLAFSTVLPAVISTQEFLLTYRNLFQGFDRLAPLPFPYPSTVAASCAILGVVTLWGLGFEPRFFYPFLWISPLLLLVGMQEFRGRWSSLFSAALAALVCGLLWEVWNVNSLPKWIYIVPWVPDWKIFEMPLIGYFGYLPFGLECYAVARLLRK